MHISSFVPWRWSDGDGDVSIVVRLTCRRSMVVRKASAMRISCCGHRCVIISSVSSANFISFHRLLWWTVSSRTSLSYRSQLQLRRLFWNYTISSADFCLHHHPHYFLMTLHVADVNSLPNKKLTHMLLERSLTGQESDVHSLESSELNTESNYSLYVGLVRLGSSRDIIEPFRRFAPERLVYIELYI